MIVIYRITSIPSSNPSPILHEDKLALNRVCLNSFLTGFMDIEPHVIFIADHCQDDQIKMIKEEVDFEYEILRTELGINETMNLSYDIACKHDDYVLFQECDYLYQPVIGWTFEAALKELKLVSPYDHRNFYMDPSIHSEECRIKLVNNCHFRTTERNTMTWGTHSSIVRDNLGFLQRHGYLDVEVWEDFRKVGYPLWVPIPSMATHMVTDYLSPDIDWEAIWQEYL